MNSALKINKVKVIVFLSFNLQKHPHAYLKGKAPPPCTKSTTAFTWEASSVEVGEYKN